MERSKKIPKEKQVSCRVMGNTIYPTCMGREELEGPAAFLRKLKKYKRGGQLLEVDERIMVEGILGEGNLHLAP